MLCPHCKEDLHPVRDWFASQRGKSGAWCRYCLRKLRNAQTLAYIEKCHARAIVKFQVSEAESEVAALVGVEPAEETKQ